MGNIRVLHYEQYGGPNGKPGESPGRTVIVNQVLLYTAQPSPVSTRQSGSDWIYFNLKVYGVVIFDQRGSG